MRKIMQMLSKLFERRKESRLYSMHSIVVKERENSIEFMDSVGEVVDFVKQYGDGADRGADWY